jgi:hypothetical protein
MSTRLEIYRLRAAECESMASMATKPSNRQAFVDLAKLWRDLANSAEHIERLWADNDPNYAGTAHRRSRRAQESA